MSEPNKPDWDAEFDAWAAQNGANARKVKLEVEFVFLDGSLKGEVAAMEAMDPLRPSVIMDWKDKQENGEQE